MVAIIIQAIVAIIMYSIINNNNISVLSRGSSRERNEANRSCCSRNTFVRHRHHHQTNNTLVKTILFISPQLYYILTYFIFATPPPINTTSKKHYNVWLLYTINVLSLFCFTITMLTTLYANLRPCLFKVKIYPSRKGKGHLLQSPAVVGDVHFRSALVEALQQHTGLAQELTRDVATPLAAPHHRRALVSATAAAAAS